MSKKLYEEDLISGIAQGIRDINGSSDKYMLSQMWSRLYSINSAKDQQTDIIAQIATELQNKTSGGGGITPTGTIDITANGEYDVTQYAMANVALPEVFKYSGTNAQLVASYNETYTLADTSFVIGSSTSTSATSIKATVSNRFTSPTIAFGDKDIVVIQRGFVTPTHSASATNKALQIAYATEYYTVISKRKTTDTSAKTTRQVYNITTGYMNKYYNTSGTITRVASNYGLYMTCSAPSVASATAASTTVRVSSPVLYYRVSSSYESAANIVLVNACDFKWTVDVYTVDAFTNIASAMSDDLDDMLVNGLTV